MPRLDRWSVSDGSIAGDEADAAAAKQRPWPADGPALLSAAKGRAARTADLLADRSMARGRCDVVSRVLLFVCVGADMPMLVLIRDRQNFLRSSGTQAAANGGE